MALSRTPEQEHQRLVELASESGLNKPPRRPDPHDCCDRSCGLCIWDDYEIRLRRWRTEAGLADPNA